MTEIIVWFCRRCYIYHRHN